MGKLEIVPDGTVMAALIDQSAGAWQAYTEHPFVDALASGSLPQACFRHYLIQDYIFLIHFSRAWALAAFKSENIEDIRQSATILSGLINDEIQLHIHYCAGFGVSEREMQTAGEANANMAYTRFVMERGLTGDLLDLLVALAPCVIGYGEIAARIMRDPKTMLADNPYRSWIDMYAGDEYRTVMRTATDQIERVARARLGDEPGRSGRWPPLVRDFDKACSLEADFWQMGLDAL